MRERLARLTVTFEVPKSVNLVARELQRKHGGELGQVARDDYFLANLDLLDPDMVDAYTPATPNDDEDLD